MIVTQDDDFLRLHSLGYSHAGIVYAQQQTSIGDILRGLILIHQIMEQSEMNNHIEFL